MKTKIIIISCLALVLVGMSGCTTNLGNNTTTNTPSNTPTNAYSDLEVMGTPTVGYNPDGTGNIIASIINNGNTTYTSIDVTITGYNNNKQVVYQKNQTIASIAPGNIGNIFIVLNKNEKGISYADVVVVNATKT